MDDLFVRCVRLIILSQLVCAGNFLYVFSLYIGKVSVAFFFWRLTDFRSAWAKGFIAVSGAFGIAAVLALAIQTGSRSWLYEETTSNGMVCDSFTRNLESAN